MNRRKTLLDSLTPEEKQLKETKRDKYIKSLSSEYQLGYFVGEYIYNNFLPCISIDMIITNKCIMVTKEEFDHHKNLDDKWIKSYQVKEEKDLQEWNELRDYHTQMEFKYLPHELVCTTPILNLNDVSEFKKGLRNSLWNCDICHYKISTDDDILIEHDKELLFSKIILKLDNPLINES